MTIREIEIQPIKQDRRGWTQCSERDATAFFVATWPDRRPSRRFDTRSEAAAYRNTFFII